MITTTSKLKAASIIAALLTTVGAREARATLLTPGSVDPIDPATLPIPGMITSVTDGFSTGGGLALMTGTVTTTVYANDPAHDPNGLGGLIFTYDIHVTSSSGGHVLQSLSLPNWLGFVADAYQTSGAGLAPAQTAGLDASGTVHFNFSTATVTSTFDSGDSTTLILVSDASSYNASLFSVQDGLADNGNTLAPGAATVPDGSLTVALIGIGILGLEVFRRAVSA